MKKRQRGIIPVRSGTIRPDDRQFLVALARGLTILKAIGGTPETLGNAELAKLTGISKATVSRLTYTLCALGYLEYIEPLGRYRMAAGAVALGYAALSGRVISHTAQPHMRALAERTGLAVAMGTRSGLHMVYLANERTDDLVTLRLHPGSAIPMASTAMGHGYLAMQLSEVRRALIGALRAERTPRWREIHSAIQANVELYDHQGFCAVAGLWHPHVNAVAVPFSPTDGSPAVVFSCGGLSTYAPSERLIRELGPALVKTVATIKQVLETGAT